MWDFQQITGKFSPLFPQSSWTVEEKKKDAAPSGKLYLV